ncbi:hypothetical protein SCLCIDRAFT_1217083 [Scleroderma citrinum Foug A]|uniref:Uncharacterized protein n=1 Tax=Scleroderma citrinum Foug A TaxID=1036808 RepID=A0A0C3A5R3_9AGAM|nr:hypothetical protein SCLCIDRAFT_1217083 [Scleroderma citrinum Foug A]
MLVVNTFGRTDDDDHNDHDPVTVIPPPSTTIDHCNTPLPTAARMHDDDKCHHHRFQSLPPSWHSQ